MTELRQRAPRQEDAGYLAFLRRKPCCVCGAPPRSQAAHVRMPCLDRGKEYTGKGQKPHDRWAVPLCFDCHREQHDGSEEAFWRRARMDQFVLAMNFYMQYCRRKGRSARQREAVVKRAARMKRRRTRPHMRTLIMFRAPKVKPVKRRVRVGHKIKAWPSRPFPKRRKQ